MNIKRSFISISSVTAVLLLTACSSGGGGGSAVVEEPQLTISGIISDGPIYGAAVEVVNPLDNTVLGTATTSSTQETIGGYSLAISNAPETFVIRSTGGTDSGPDGLMNANDRVNQSEMKTVARKPAVEGEDVSANATPATTLIAGFVEDQAAAGEELNLDAAQEIVTKALGLPAGTDLVSLDPKTDPIASKAASFVANIVDSLPSSDNAASFKSISNVFKENTGSSFANISADTVAVNDNFSISDIAKDMVKVDATSINASDIAKLEKSDATISTQLQAIVENSKPVDSMTEAEQIQAVSAEQTLDILNKEIANTIDASALSVNDLNKLAVNTQAVLADIMTNSETGVDAVDNSNVAVLASVIKENIDNIADISADTFSNVAEKSKEMAAEIQTSTADAENSDSSDISNSIVENMFSKLDLTTADTLVATLASLDEIQISDIVTISETIVEKSAESSTDASTQANFTESMTDIIASSITNNLSGDAALDFTAIADNSVNNAALVETMTEIAVAKAEVEAKVENLQTGEELSGADLSTVLAGNTIADSISNSFAENVVVFDAAMATNFDAMKDSMEVSIQTAITDTVAGELVDVTNAMTAMETSGDLVDATATDFSVDSFDSINETVAAAIVVAEESGEAGTVDIAATVDALVEQIEIAVESGTSLEDAVTQEADKVAELVEVVEDPIVEDPIVEDPTVEDPIVEDPIVEDPVTPPASSTPAATTKTTAVTDLQDGTTNDASTLASTYNFTAGTYTYTVTGFASGDVLNFPDENTATIINTDFTDNAVIVQWAYNGSVIQVNLTGLGVDSGIYGLTSFNTAYSAGSIQ